MTHKSAEDIYKKMERERKFNRPCRFSVAEMGTLLEYKELMRKQVEDVAVMSSDPKTMQQILQFTTAKNTERNLTDLITTHQGHGSPLVNQLFEQTVLLKTMMMAREQWARAMKSNRNVIYRDRATRSPFYNINKDKLRHMKPSFDRELKRMEKLSISINEHTKLQTRLSKGRKGGTVAKTGRDISPERPDNETEEGNETVSAESSMIIKHHAVTSSLSQSAAYQQLPSFQEKLKHVLDSLHPQKQPSAGDSHDGIKEAPVDSYIIPTQSGDSCHSLILYTAVEREGAVEEAERLQAGLAHCTAPKVKQWVGVTDLMAELHKYLTEIPRDCKLLIVCIMGHGTVGYITGKDGSKIPANDVLNLASKELNFKLPTIILFQVCQSYQSEAIPSHHQQIDMARKSTPTANRHIVLTRPHTVLLMATVTGGSAYREAYTGAMADQFCLADGKKDIHQMHILAVQQMKKAQIQEQGQYPEHRDILAKKLEQTPEYRDTLEKRLVLFPIGPQAGTD